MPQPVFIADRAEFLGDVNLLLGGRVEAYDRHFPNLSTAEHLNSWSNLPLMVKRFSSVLNWRSYLHQSSRMRSQSTQ
jgi:hypothetical protein